MTDHVNNMPTAPYEILKYCVAHLPEIYQPIFGHPELSIHVSRNSTDRWCYLNQLYGLLEQALQRPLRVLDLGCAQGFFSLSLAQLGASVDGIDYQTANIAVCQALALEHPNLNVTFTRGYLEPYLIQLQQDQYDLVLGLSVFHHLVHQSGVPYVQNLLTLLANKIAVGIFEMALPSEPPAWAVSQPRDPLLLLQGYALIHCVAQHATHLSSVQRPLYIATNRQGILHDF